MVTGCEYQPFESGARPGVPALTCGGVASYLRVNGFEAELPALSLQLPVTVADPSSGPE